MTLASVMWSKRCRGLQHPFRHFRFTFAFFFGLIYLGFGFWHLYYDVNANADFSFAIAALLLAGAAFDYFRGDGKDKGSSAMPVKTDGEKRKE